MYNQDCSEGENRRKCEPIEINSSIKSLDNWRDALPEMLITDLQQSKYLRVLGGERIYGMLQKLNLTEAEKYSTGDLKRVASCDDNRFSCRAAPRSLNDNRLLCCSASYHNCIFFTKNMSIIT